MNPWGAAVGSLLMRSGNLHLTGPEMNRGERALPDPAQDTDNSDTSHPAPSGRGRITVAGAA